MRSERTSAVFLSALVFAGCTYSSGVVPIGDDRYRISRSEKGVDITGSHVEADAIKEANKYCAEKGKEIELIDAWNDDMVPFSADAQATIRFRCVESK